MANYEQYKLIARTLSAAPHSILFLTGDVHFGRIASCTLPSSAEIIEIISSPLALVDASAGGSWEEPPDFFPSEAIPGVPKSEIKTEKTLQLTDNHFLTLEFYQRGARVHVAVKAWPIPLDASAPKSKVVYEHWLH